MSNHTPGPWTVRPVPNPGLVGHIGYAIDFNEDQEQVVDFVYEEADAHLIAAAPDMFAALVLVVDNAQQRTFEDWFQRVRPSGDADSVHAQWLDSIDYLDFTESWAEQLGAIDKARVKP